MFYCNQSLDSFLFKEFDKKKADTDVTLSNNSLNKKNFPKLLKALSHIDNLESLTITSNGLNCDQVIDIIKSINTNSLQYLCLGGNKIWQKGAIETANLIKKTSNLQQVLLGFNRIDDRGCIALLDAVKTNKNITTLYLSDNSIKSDGILHCESLIKESINRKLSLSLGYNKYDTSTKNYLLNIYKELHFECVNSESSSSPIFTHKTKFSLFF